MKYLISILLIFTFLSVANAEQLADRCSFFEKKFNDELLVDQDPLNWIPHIMNRTNISDIHFRKMIF